MKDLNISDIHKKGIEVAKRIEAEVKKSIFGIDDAIEDIILSLFTAVPRDGGRNKYLGRAHFLFMDKPGFGKTAILSIIAQAISAKHTAISGEPTKEPREIVGGEIYNPKTGMFYTAKGPIFTNLFRYEEINRSGPKAHSPLISAMEEGIVDLTKTDLEEGKMESVVHNLYPVSDDEGETRRYFQVFASANPVEQDGTYPLPEALLDRFTLSSRIGYPNRGAEKMIRWKNVKEKTTKQVTSLAEILEYSEYCADNVEITDDSDEYIMRITENSRPVSTDHRNKKRPNAERDLKEYIEDALIDGISPRANFHFEALSKAVAFLNKRTHVAIDDVKRAAPLIMRHRIRLKPGAKAKGVSPDDVISRILKDTKQPGVDYG